VQDFNVINNTTSSEKSSPSVLSIAALFLDESLNFTPNYSNSHQNDNLSN
jgi:hypothetical protein